MERPVEPETSREAGAAPLGPPSFVHAIAQNLRFYSRLPAPRLPGETHPYATPDFTTLPRALPIAALIIAAPQAAVLAFAVMIGLPPLIGAALAVTALILSTGAFHEDGLADAADGFGGGATIGRKLEIMKDSRVGTYGATAVCLSILIRVVALAALLDARPIAFVISIVAATAVLSRLVGLMPLTMLPPARMDGASAQVGRPTTRTLIVACALGAAITAAAAASAGWAPGLGAAMIAAAITAGLAMTWISARQIAGQTGDVSGAAQQIAEVACLMVPLASAFAS